MQHISHTSTIADGNMSLRYGEKSEVLSNRSRFIKNLGLNPERSVLMDSPHQDIVTIIYDSNPTHHFELGDVTRGDSLITQLPNTPLLLTTADCLPVTFYDAVTTTIGLMHLSRHTFCLNLIPKTTAVLRDTLGVSLSNLKVSIGPHIHGASYSFPLPLAETHEKLIPYISYTGANAHIDLKRAAIDSLKNLGVSEAHIWVSATDTFTSDNHFSHVRSVRTGEPEGRLMTAAALIP